jgi:multiple sugar transport system substrate-binding protein
MNAKKVLFALVGALVVSGLAFAAGGQKVLKVAHFYDPMSESSKVNSKWFDDIAAQFAKENPGAKVEFELFQWDQIDVKAMSDFRSGIKSHDVILTSPQLAAQHAQVGDLADLSGMVSQSWSKQEQAEFNWSSAWKGGIVGDKLYGIALGNHSRVLVYNKDMFKAAGLDPNKPPKTIDELIADAKKLTKDTNGDGIPEVYGLGMFFGPSRATNELYFSPLLWGSKTDTWDPVTKKASFASPAGIKAAQFFRDLVYTYKVTPSSDLAGTYDDAILTSFLNGRIAMGWGFGSYWIAQLEAKGMVKGCFPATASGVEVNAGVALLPGCPTFTNAWNASIYSLSENKDLAWKFINIMLKAENLRNYADAGLPIRASEWNKPEMKTPFYKVWKDSIATGHPMPATAHYGELSDTVAAALQNILVSNEGIETTLTKAQDEYNAKYAGN